MEEPYFPPLRPNHICDFRRARSRYSLFPHPAACDALSETIRTEAVRATPLLANTLLTVAASYASCS
jgi:hypothetical protein